MWALTPPQVPSTLPATLVAYHTVTADGQRMLDERTLNAVLVLMRLLPFPGGPDGTIRTRMLDAETREREPAG